MAGSSAVTFLFSYSSSLVSVFRTRCGETSADCYPSWFPTSVSLATGFRRAICFSSPDHRRRRRRRVTIARKSGRDDEGEPFVWDDQFGTYPWDPSFAADEGIQWVQGDRITLFTSEGLVQIGGSLIPQRVPSHDKNKARRGASQRLQRFQESDYMDPDQKLCLGALFDIAATNVWSCFLTLVAYMPVSHNLLIMWLTMSICITGTGHGPEIVYIWLLPFH